MDDINKALRCLRREHQSMIFTKYFDFIYQSVLSIKVTR